VVLKDQQWVLLGDIPLEDMALEEAISPSPLDSGDPWGQISAVTS